MDCDSIAMMMERDLIIVNVYCVEGYSMLEEFVAVIIHCLETKWKTLTFSERHLEKLWFEL